MANKAWSHGNITVDIILHPIWPIREWKKFFQNQKAIFLHLERPLKQSISSHFGFLSISIITVFYVILRSRLTCSKSPYPPGIAIQQIKCATANTIFYPRDKVIRPLNNFIYRTFRYSNCTAEAFRQCSIFFLSHRLDLKWKQGMYTFHFCP